MIFMYKIITVSDNVKVSPKYFSKDVSKSIKDSLIEQLEGNIDDSLGVILNVINIISAEQGDIFPEDPCIFYPTKFELLVYQPELHEIVKGVVVDLTEFGVFVRIGPIDGLVHVSQLMDDFVSYDEKNLNLVGKKTKRILKVGDSVIARIVSISMKMDRNKIGLTMRQEGLGALHWLERSKKADK